MDFGRFSGTWYVYIIMIVDGFLLIISLMLAIFGSFLGALSFAIPPQISTYITEFFSFFGYFTGILPVSDMLLALIFLLDLFILKYLVKLILGVMGSIPFIGTGFNRLGFFNKGTRQKARHER